MKQAAVVAMLASLAMGAQFPRNGGHIHRHKRQDVIVTVTSEVIVTDIETVWVTAGQDNTPQTSAAEANPTSVAQPSIVVTSSSQAAVAPHSTSAEAPVVVPSQKQNPTTAAAPPASSAQAPAASSSAPAGGSGTGQVYTGEATWYTPDGGSGSCGTYDKPDHIQNSDHVVALSAAAFMDAGKATYCYKTIEITGPMGKFPATIADTCPGCTDAGHLDLPSEFYTLVTGDTHDISTSKGHMPISWQFTS